MAYQRESVQSYQKWADHVGDQGFTFNNLLPYFDKSLNFTPPNFTKKAANSTPQYDLMTLGNGSGPLKVTFPKYAQPFASWV